MEWLTSPDIWIALLTLTLLEIVLGIDNIVFIAILVDKLPEQQRARARLLGLAGAMLMRIALLLAITWIMRLTTPLITLLGFALSGRDLILLIGGLFLLAKATWEIHDKLEGSSHETHAVVHSTFASVIAQIMVLDIVFSLDSVITAVGMADEVAVMVAAVVIAIVVMMIAARSVSEFVERHPTVKMLALSFLLLIGMALVAEGLHQHIPKGYIYFSMGFSVFVEMLNLRIRGQRRRPATLRPSYDPEH